MVMHSTLAGKEDLIFCVASEHYITINDNLIKKLVGDIL